MKHVSNEQKAKEIANDNCTHICLAECSAESYFSSENDCYKAAMQAMQWKDKERKELWRITRNRWQEWAEEQERQLIDNLREVLAAHMHGGEIDEVLAELDEKMKGE